MHSLLRALLVILLTLALSACAAKTDERLERLEAQAREQSIFDLRLEHLEERVTHVESVIGELREQTAPPAGRPGLEQAFRRAARRLSGASEHRIDGRPVGHGSRPVSAINQSPGSHPLPSPAVGVGVAPVNDPFAGPGLTTVFLVPGPNGAPVVTPDGGGRAGSRVVAPKPSSSRSSAAGSGTGLSAYDAACALYEKGEYARAQQVFADFLAASPKSSLAPNAVYWQGECQYSLCKYYWAIIFFQNVINRYPKHAKAAAAPLKAGYSYERLKDMDNARFYWQILVDDFPKSAPAVLARKRLTG